MQVLLSTAYFAPIEWLSFWVQSTGCLLEAHEHYQKQSFRSRTSIAGPNGAQTLSVPVLRTAKGIQDIEISYAESWQRVHLKAIESAYSNAPFFDVLFPDVEHVLSRAHKKLWDLNLATIELYADWLELDAPYQFTKQFTPNPIYERLNADVEPHSIDARGLHPKHPSRTRFPSYQQVFQHKIGFQHNLSALDLFFNLGRSSWDYLNDLQKEPPTNRI